MRRLIVVALAVVALLALEARRPAVYAGSPCIVPRSWGSVRALALGSYGNPLLTFEAADGTVRIIPAECKMPPSPVYSVQRSDD